MPDDVAASPGTPAVALDRASGELRDLLREAETTPWEALRARASAAQAAWAAAAAGPPGGLPATGDAPGEAAAVCARAAAALRDWTDALASVAVAGEARVRGAEIETPEAPDAGRALELMGRWWPQLEMTLATLPKLPEPGPVIASPLGLLTVRQGVVLLLREMEEHAAQLRALQAKGGGGHDR